MHMALHWERRRSSSGRWSAAAGLVLVTISLNMNQMNLDSLEGWCQKSIQCQISFISEISSLGCRAAEQGFTQNLVLSRCYAAGLLLGDICMETYQELDD